MTAFARLSVKDRRLFFQEYQARYGVDSVIVEKDFWVVWLLGLLSVTPPLTGNFVFKGGTSLSKIFQAIHRFSEDVDLSIDPALLGCNEEDLDDAPSRSQRQKRMKALEARCAKEVETIFLPALESAALEKLQARPAGSSWFEYHVDPGTNSPVLLFFYPTEHTDSASAYIPRQVKLEFGSLTDQRPAGSHPITAMIDALGEGGFEDCRTKVVVLELERTFWEKATILHAEFYRQGNNARERYSRHYADFAALWQHPEGKIAATRWDLLARVRLHKERFFASAWCNYDAARPGTLRLVPPPDRISALRKDYREMRQMFLAEPPSFEDILEVLRDAEQTLNAS